MGLFDKRSGDHDKTDQDIFEIDVDISVIKIGGSFDNLPFIPFE